MIELSVISRLVELANISFLVVFNVIFVFDVGGLSRVWRDIVSPGSHIHQPHTTVCTHIPTTARCVYIYTNHIQLCTRIYQPQMCIHIHQPHTAVYTYTNHRCVYIRIHQPHTAVYTYTNHRCVYIYTNHIHAVYTYTNHRCVYIYTNHIQLCTHSMIRRALSRAGIIMLRTYSGVTMHGLAAAKGPGQKGPIFKAYSSASWGNMGPIFEILRGGGQKFEVRSYSIENIRIRTRHHTSHKRNVELGSL